MTKPFDFAFWVEGPWEADPVLDEALAKERPKAMLGQKLPGRNEPCTCGSGKKFKKCCLGKITVLPR
ncbi:MAG: SEC-C domain-containing protein [Verrucomicrobia bacterium]|nr:SEC-C domain-containing protein [Verrucomicrobiota bacterium]